MRVWVRRWSFNCCDDDKREILEKKEDIGEFCDGLDMGYKRGKSRL